VSQYGGSVDWRPLVELGALTLANEMALEGLLEKKTAAKGVTISLTEKGKELFARSTEARR